MTRVADLEGAELADWVARALGYSRASSVPADVCGYWWDGESSGGVEDYKPHENWAQGGPLIDKYKISIVFEEYGDGRWEASNVIETGEHTSCENRMYGPTALIAAMRSMVHSVYGEKVPD